MELQHDGRPEEGVIQVRHANGRVEILSFAVRAQFAVQDIFGLHEIDEAIAEGQKNIALVGGVVARIAATRALAEVVRSAATIRTA